MRQLSGFNDDGSVALALQTPDALPGVWAHVGVDGLVRPAQPRRPGGGRCMEPLRSENDLTADDQPSLGGGESISPQPAQGQHSGDSVADAVPVVQALVDVWSAALLEVAPLMHLLGSYLEKYAFLRLRFTPRGIRVEGKHVSEDEVSRELATLLLGDEITELLLKDGVAPEEIETLLDVLRQGRLEVPVNFDSLATLLWEAELQRVVFQCADELPGNQAREIEAFDMDNTALPVSNQMIADPKDEATVSAVLAMDKFPRLDVEKLSIPLKRALFLSPNDELAASSLAVTTSDESLQNLIHRLVDVYSSETDSALQEDADTDSSGLNITIPIGNYVQLSTHLQYDETDYRLTRLEDESILWGVGLTATDSSYRFFSGIQFDLNQTERSDDSFDERSQFVSMNMGWHVFQAQGLQPGLALSLDGTWNDFDDRVNAGVDMDQYQVFLRATVQWGAAY